MKIRYCYEMTSRKEVMYYFKTCGLNRLDGDKDGILVKSFANEFIL